MTKPIDWPTPTNTAYRGDVATLRTYLEDVARQINSSPDFAVEVDAHLTTFDTDVVQPALA